MKNNPIHLEKSDQDVVYSKLAAHLDSLPDGFPPSSTGADLRLLQLLFTTEEAELAVHTRLEREDAALIAQRAAQPLEIVQERLEQMAVKGLILPVQAKDGSRAYQAVPFVVGIYEYQVNNLTPEFLKALDDYWSTTIDRPQPETIPQMRTIPVGKSLSVGVDTMTYDQVYAIVDSRTRFAVAPCICRRRAKLKGKGCNAPEESCLVFNEWADFYIRTGRGREVDRAGLLNLLARADAANLVLQPSNSQDVDFICCCCGCCCGVLRGLQNHPRPADLVSNLYWAALDANTCEGCWTCLERCQMKALVEDGSRVALKQERCIGCGLCVTTCPSSSLALVKKPQSVPRKIPVTFNDTWHRISQEQPHI